ncbi:hypothetical protein [Alishewanella sp. HL-SH05]|uniref:hypothetical protein n=1 Tax=Alishewanella sp. HL-SH05 TaxID=3461145 RepID=UPI004043208B
MQELTFEQVEEVSGGFVALYWIAKGSYIAGKAAVSYATRHYVTTAVGIGVAVELMSD